MPFATKAVVRWGQDFGQSISIGKVGWSIQQDAHRGNREVAKQHLRRLNRGTLALKALSRLDAVLLGVDMLIVVFMAH